MPIVKDRKASLDNLDDLKVLLSGTGPCLSVYLSLSNASTAGRNPNAKENELRWRECLHLVEAQASRFGDAGTQVLDSMRNFESVMPDSGGEVPSHSRKSLAVFRSPEVFQVVELDEEVADQAVFGETFHIRPLVKELVRTRKFYLLGFSQKNTRLLHCTTRTSEELAFANGFKTDFEEWMNQAKPDHRAIDNAMAVGAQGSARPDALAPKGSDAEDRDEYLVHFAKHIAGGVAQVLKGKSEPLVLCAVEYEIPIYREANTYPHLAAEAVHGAPNGLKSGEMHSRAIEALNRCYGKKVDDALQTRGEGPNDDLVNDAVVQTILHAGKVLVVEAAKMPDKAAVAATFRF
jgi:hypothetical protein